MNYLRTNATILIVIQLMHLLQTDSAKFVQGGERSSARSSRNLLAIHRQKHADLNKKLFMNLEELAQFCDRNQLTEAAKEIRAKAVPVDHSLLKIQQLPRRVQPEMPAGLNQTEHYWRSRFKKLNEEHARQLFLISRRALKVGSASFAYQLLHEAAQFDPDNRSARRLLGFVRQGEIWVTPFAARMLRLKKVFHEKYGWLPAAHVERYEQGERYYKGRWISVAQEVEYRRDFKNAWRIETDHYIVRTNHSLEKGVAIARAMENYYAFFFQTFAGFFNTPEQLNKLFAGGSRGVGSRKQRYEVHFFKTQEEYNRRLISKIPQIAMTNGLYYTSDRVVYSFDNPKMDTRPTLYHEATHQIFYESTAKDRSIADKSHFWLIEGIACYMESFQHVDGKLSMGDPNNIRFIAARRHLLLEKYYIPLSQFDRLGMKAFQADRNIRKNYSQAAGLAHFFMHFNGGEYRDALIMHLSQLYAPVSNRFTTIQSLDELTGISFDKLDQQYSKYMLEMQKRVERAQASHSNDSEIQTSRRK